MIGSKLNQRIKHNTIKVGIVVTLLKTKYALHTKIGVNQEFTPRIPYHGVDNILLVCITYYAVVCITHSHCGMYRILYGMYYIHATQYVAHSIHATQWCFIRLSNESHPSVHLLLETWSYFPKPHTTLTCNMIIKTM